jgi:mannose-1-phosphate guanylyltransferase
MYCKPVNEADVRNRCAIILAAGEGVRLRSFVQRLRGDTLPKQYVKFFGSKSMLQTTFKRAERLIPPERTFTVVDQKHCDFAEVTQKLVAQPKIHFVIHPSNRDTAIGLLLPLAHLLERYPDATVAVFPSDHFISDDDLFMAHVDAGSASSNRTPPKSSCSEFRRTPPSLTTVISCPTMIFAERFPAAREW